MARGGRINQPASTTIDDESVDSDAYVDGSIDLVHMSAESVDSDQYVDLSIDAAHIAGDAVTAAKIGDDVIDSEHYAAASVDFAHIQNVAANSVLGRNANSSGVLSEIALATTQILIGDGTGFVGASLSGDATMANDGAVTLAAAQTNVNSLLATDIVIGEDAQTQIDFETANEIHIDADNAERVKIDATGLVMTSGSITINAATADETASGIVASFTAGEDLVRGEVVYFKAGDSKMWKAVATATGTMPVVAMAAADVSADAAGLFLLQGFLQDNGSFPALTVAGRLYAPEAETSSQNVPEQTAPDSDGDFVQDIGFAVTANLVYFSPSGTVIEHA